MTYIEWGDMMKLFVLNLGMVDVEASILDSRAVAGSRAKVPTWSLLIRHDKGNIVFDLGCMPNAMEEDGWRKSLREVMFYEHRPEETMEQQLAYAGITAQEVDTVIVSHLHEDHFGNIAMFCHADVYVPKEHWIEQLVNTHIVADESKHDGYRWQLDLPVKAYHPIGIGEDMEVISGVEILTLPGHTSNLLGLCVHTQDKTWLFPSDCAYSPYNMEVLPGACVDAMRYRDSINKIKAFQKKYNAEIVFSHYNKQFDELPKAPNELT